MASRSAQATGLTLSTPRSTPRSQQPVMHPCATPPPPLQPAIPSHSKPARPSPASIAAPASRYHSSLPPSVSCTQHHLRPVSTPSPPRLDQVEIDINLSLMMLDWVQHKDITRVAQWVDPHMLGSFVKAVMRVASYLDVVKEVFPAPSPIPSPRYPLARLPFLLSGCRQKAVVPAPSPIHLLHLMHSLHSLYFLHLPSPRTLALQP